MKKKTILEKLHLRKKNTSFLDRLILFLLVFGAVMLVFLIGRSVYHNLPQSQLSSHLPADKTVAYLTVEDWKLPSTIKLPEGTENIISSLNALAGIEIDPMIKDFGTGRVAYALLDGEASESDIVIFIQAKSQRSALNHFKSLLLPGEELRASRDKDPIYTFPQGQSFAFKFFDRYVAVSPKPEVLKSLLSEGELALEQDKDYIKTINQLPRNNWLFVYLDLEKITLSANTGINNMLEPLKHAVNHVALSVRSDQKGFHFNTFFNLNKEMLSLDASGGEKFGYELSQYIPAENLTLYLGGENLAAEWQNTLESISSLNPSYGIILEGLLRAQIDKLFGQNVDLRNDLYPLFEGEYAFFVSKGKEEKELSLILTHDDKLFAERKMEKMAQGFKFIAASFAPKVAVVTLPDGTESRELVPDNSQIKNESEEMNGYQINCTQIGETQHGFCYAINESMVIMSTNKDILLDSIAADASHLSEDPSYRRSVSNLSKVTDEISFVRFDSLPGLFSDRPYLQLIAPLLSSFDSATWVKRYFEDGMSSEGYLLLK